MKMKFTSVFEVGAGVVVETLYRVTTYNQCVCASVRERERESER